MEIRLSLYKFLIPNNIRFDFIKNNKLGLQENSMLKMVLVMMNIFIGMSTPRANKRICE